MLDAVRFEELGLPAAAIVTEPFTTTGKVMAEMQGFADYPFATVPHPIGSLSEDQVTALADAVTPAVESLLLRGEAGPVAAAGVEPGSLDAVVESLAVALRADRADLTVEQSGSRITFRLHIPDEACAECVMPSSMLVPMFQHRVDQELGPGLTVELEDSRTSVQ